MYRRALNAPLTFKRYPQLQCIYNTRFISSVPKPKVTNTNESILNLIPNRGKATVIGEDGERTERVSISRFVSRELNKKKFQLVVVSMRQAVETESNSPQQQQDPHLICKVVPLPEDYVSDSKARYLEDKKSRKQKPSGQKEKRVPVSWTISENDLRGQKKQAIASVMTRGHKAHIELKSKMRYLDNPKNLTDLELERREKVVELIKEIAGELGTEYKRPQGTIRGPMTLYFTPNSSS